MATVQGVDGSVIGETREYGDEKNSLTVPVAIKYTIAPMLNTTAFSSL
jgi:hypothetical protein